MKTNVQDVKTGDQVFLFSHSKYPTVVKVVRSTANFVFIEGKNYVTNQVFEKKFRRDGSSVEQYNRARLHTIEGTDIQDYEKDQKNDKRINEIINLLNSKGFKFNGYSSWYSIETWEKLVTAFTA